MLQLYDLNKKKIKGLKLYKDYCVESVLTSGDKTLSFLYPARQCKEVLEECYISTKTDEFVVKEIADQGEWKSIKATLNVENLEGQAWEHFETVEKTISESITLAIAGTGWTIGTCNITKRRTIRKINCSSWDIIQQAKKTYLAEIEFDTINKKINIAEKLGSDKGVYFIDSLNLRNLDIQSNSYDYYTRMIAIGKDNLKVTVENFQYSQKKKTLIWKDERYIDINALTEDATAKLDEIAKPYKAYGADVIDLSNTSNKYSVLSYNLGDTIALISKDKGIKEKQRIVKIVEYPEEPHRNNCEIANSILSFADVQKEYQDTTDTVNNITIDNGTVDGSTINSIKTEQIEDFKANVIDATNITAINASIENLSVNKADIQSLNAVTSRIGTLEATTATITQLNAVNASIINLQANKANIGDLTAAVGKINILESNVADIGTLVNGNLTSSNIQSLILTSSKVTVETGFIKNAMIESLNVSKINAGDISTNKFRIKSDNGGIEIVGATQQFKDKNNRVRIQMGQDTQGDFNFILRGEDGTTTLIDHNGIKEKAIANDLIKGNMISENAIGGKQIDYNSFTEEFNKDTNTHTLKSSKVLLDETNQTLNVAFNRLDTKVDNIEVGGRNYVKKLGGNTYDINSIYGADRSYSAFETINSKKWLKYSGNIVLRTDSILIQSNTTYTWSFNIYTTGEDKDITCTEWDGTSYNSKRYSISTIPTKISHTFTSKDTSTYEILHIQSLLSDITYYFSDFKLEKGNKATDWTPAPEDVEQKIETNTTTLNVQQGKIDSLISNTTIVKDGKTIQLKDSYNSTVATVDSINSTIGSHESTINALAGQIIGVNTKTNTLERTLEETLLKVDSIQGEQSENLILNGNFVGGQNNWTWTGDSYVGRDICTATDNTKWFYAEGGYGLTLSIKQKISLKNGIRYLFKAKIGEYQGYDVKLNIRVLVISSYAGGDRIIASNRAYDCYGDLMKPTQVQFPLELEGELGDINYLQIEVTSDRDEAYITDIQLLEPILGNYATVSSVAEIKIKADSIENTVNSNRVDANGKIFAMQTSITQLKDSITMKVNSLQSNVDGQGARLNTAESKLTSNSLTTTISSAIDSGASLISTTKFVMDRNGFTVRNGAITVLNANSQVVIDGKYNMHKIVLSGTINISMAAGQYQRTATITHNLGYIPASLCFIQADNGFVWNFPYMSYINFSGTGGLTINELGRAWANSTLLEFVFVRPQDLTPAITYKVRYYIYKEAAI